MSGTETRSVLVWCRDQISISLVPRPGLHYSATEIMFAYTVSILNLSLKPRLSVPVFVRSFGKNSPKVRNKNLEWKPRVQG